MTVARLRRVALAVGGTAAAACALGLLGDRARVAQAWLVGVLTWTSAAVGALALALLHRLTGGAWGRGLRDVLDAAAGTLPLLALLFAPLLLDLDAVWSWAAPDAHLGAKAAWLDPAFFVGRGALYFGAWCAGAALLRRGRLPAGPALALLGLTASFAAFDWLMSLDPHWISTMQGLLFVAGAAVSALAVAVPVALLAEPRVEPARLHDWGTLLLALVMVWAYLAFSQFLLIWSADLPEEVGYYLDRSSAAWARVAIALAVLHFALPFVLLLSRDVKRDPRALAAIALLLVAMRWLHLYWQAEPTLRDGAFRPHWSDGAAVLAVGGLFAARLAHRLEASRA